MNQDTVEASETMNLPLLISVIVATYNCSETLQRCIDSIASQTYAQVELIVIDGGSTDGTIDIIEANKQVVAYWESKPDDGIYHAWNKALKHVHGEWICFLGADDYFWSPNALESIVPILHQSYPQFRIVYSQVALINKQGDVLQYIAEPWDVVKPKFKQLMTGLPHQGVMHHQTIFEIRGEFDEKFKIAGDYELLLRELSENDALCVPEVTLTAMQSGGVSANPANSLRLLLEFRQAHRQVLKSGSGWRWWVAFFKVHCRKFLWRLLGESMTRKLLDLARVCIGKSRHWTRT